MSPIIEIKNLSKRFSSGAAGNPRQFLLREVLQEIPRRLFRSSRELSSEEGEQADLDALRSVTLSIGRGERVGLIGRNGAGKSTLLKILARVLEPTGGSALLHGRVSSLLEVGAGFHYDLSGRENIFFTGAILGMSRKEVRAQLDTIIAFAELEDSIDMPVKFYSSGMYLRLAFSVAAFLDADIVLLDEALSVGDAAFQRKCQKVIDDLSQSQKTVVLVSHDMNAIKRICTRCVWLEGGEVVMDGESSSTVQAYVERSLSYRQRYDLALPSLDLCSELQRADDRKPPIISVALRPQEEVKDLNLTIEILNSDSVLVSADTYALPSLVPDPSKLETKLLVELRTPSLAPGYYRVALSVGAKSPSLFAREEIGAWSIEDDGESTQGGGIVSHKHLWTVQGAISG